MTPQDLGWGSRSSQLLRFEQIELLPIKDKDTLLDVGCGCGDLFDYLLLKQTRVVYNGIDKSEKAVEDANNRHSFFVDAGWFKAEVKQFDDWFFIEKRDWVVASGIFCYPSDNWYKETCQTIERMYEISNHGISINFLTAINGNTRNEKMRYTTPDEVLPMTSSLSKNVKLLFGYLPNDFTIQVLR